MAGKSDLTLGLSLSDENIKVMKRFCDSVDFLKQASQSGASVSLQWPENPTAAQSAPASAAQTAPTVPPIPAPNPAPVTAAPIAPAPVAAPAVPAPSVNPTPAASPSVPTQACMAAEMEKRGADVRVLKGMDQVNAFAREVLLHEVHTPSVSALRD